MASKVNFQEAFKLFTSDGKPTLDAHQAAKFASLFAPVSEDEVLSQFRNSELDQQQLKTLVDNFTQNAPKQDELLSLLRRMNSNKTETMSKNTLYHIFKNANRMSLEQFEEFLSHLGMNNDQININQFVQKLTNMYH